MRALLGRSLANEEMVSLFKLMINVSTNNVEGASYILDLLATADHIGFLRQLLCPIENKYLFLFFLSNSLLSVNSFAKERLRALILPTESAGPPNNGIRAGFEESFIYFYSSEYQSIHNELLKNTEDRKSLDSHIYSSTEL